MLQLSVNLFVTSCRHQRTYRSHHEHVDHIEVRDDVECFGGRRVDGIDAVGDAAGISDISARDPRGFHRDFWGFLCIIGGGNDEEDGEERQDEGVELHGGCLWADGVWFLVGMCYDLFGWVLVCNEQVGRPGINILQNSRFFLHTEGGFKTNKGLSTRVCDDQESLLGLETSLSENSTCFDV